MTRFMIQLIVVLGMCTVFNECQSGRKKSLREYSLGALMVLAYAARTVSTSTLSVGSSLATGIVHHPQLSIVCAAGLLVTVPPVRRALINTGYKGASAACCAATNWVCNLFNSYLLGDVNHKLDSASEVLTTHTTQLNSIQAVLQEVQNRINSISETQVVSENHLHALVTDIAQVRQQLDGNTTMLDALIKQLMEIQQSIPLHVNSVNNRLTSIEANQLAQTQAINAFNAVLQQIVQLVSERQQNLQKDPATNGSWLPALFHAA